MDRDGVTDGWVLVFRPTTKLEGGEARAALHAAGIATYIRWVPSAVAAWSPGRSARLGELEGFGGLWVRRDDAESAIAALLADKAGAQERVRRHLVGVSHDLRRLALIVLPLTLLGLHLRVPQSGAVLYAGWALVGVLLAWDVRHLLRRRTRP